MATIVKFDIGEGEMHMEGVSATIAWIAKNRTRLTFRFQWEAALEFVLTDEELGKLLAFASVLAENCDQPNFRDAERTMRDKLVYWTAE